MILNEVSSSASRPKVIVPRQTRETFIPERPRRRYSIDGSPFVASACSRALKHSREPGASAVWPNAASRLSSLSRALRAHARASFMLRGRMVGVLYALACALSWAAGSVSMKNLSKKLDPFPERAAGAGGGIALLILAAATGRTSGAQDLSPQALILMVGSMALGGGVGDSLYVTSMSLIGVSRAYPISCSYPAITLVLAALFLDEPITPAVVAGMVLVIGGVMLISRPSGTDSRPTSAAHTGRAWSWPCSLRPVGRGRRSF